MSFFFNTSNMIMKNRKIIFAISSLVLLVIFVVGYNFYSKIKSQNVTQTIDIFIPTNADFETVKQLISPYLKNSESFNWVAQKKNYPNKIRAGKFKISEGMSNEALVNHLRGGKPETVMITFNNQDSYEKLAGRVADQIEADSLALLIAMKDPSFLSTLNLKEETGLGLYIPNSYEFYWNTSAEEFRTRMLTEYQKFWTKDRMAKAENLKMSPSEVITLASIVQKETSTIAERPTVAGLYLNRLKDSWPLQADPTIIFALQKKYGQDTIIKRVLNSDLRVDSPYNTYKNLGLPPGPIAMPDISSIDAVLNPKKHNYYYMCASVDRLGEHEFTNSLREHNQNARKYQTWVSQQGIQR